VVLEGSAERAETEGPEDKGPTLRQLESPTEQEEQEVMVDLEAREAMVDLEATEVSADLGLEGQLPRQAGQSMASLPTPLLLARHLHLTLRSVGQVVLAEMEDKADQVELVAKEA
jgi:hypothetical protein